MNKITFCPRFWLSLMILICFCNNLYLLTAGFKLLDEHGRIKMNRNNSTSEEGEEQKKELERRNNNNNTTSRVSSSSSSSRQWSSFRDPRIVRASRAFGGKDRHSKVCTVRGLRDRRIRLSVPTAIELYDLQEKLGVSQPSKVVDWLLDATKQDIDKLPPLQMPLGFQDQFHHQQMYGGAFSGSRNLIGNLLLPHESSTSRSVFPGVRINDHFKGKEVKESVVVDEKGKCIEVNDQLYAQSFFPMMPYSFSNWDPSHFSMPQFGNHHGFQLQTENLFNPNSMEMPPQCSSNYAMPDSRQMNHFQFMNPGSSSQQLLPSLHPPMRSSFQKNADPKLLHHQANDRSDEDDSGNDDC